MASDVNKNSTIVASKDQVSCDLAGEAAILDLKSGQYYGLNEIGARIWSLIQQPRKVGEILETLLEEYHVDPRICETDLLALLDHLRAKNLLKVLDATSD